jgi:hypothetical protein
MTARLFQRRGAAGTSSRRAATGIRNDQGSRSETAEDHDRRFSRRWPLTWRFPPTLTVLNSMEFHGEMPNADLARGKPGVQIPSPPPQNTTSKAIALGRWDCAFGARGRIRTLDLPIYEAALNPRVGPVQDHRGCSGAGPIPFSAVLSCLVVTPGLPQRLPPWPVSRTWLPRSNASCIGPRSDAHSQRSASNPRSAAGRLDPWLCRAVSHARSARITGRTAWAVSVSQPPRSTTAGRPGCSRLLRAECNDPGHRC